MTIDQLEDQEKLVLIGLFHWITAADGVVTPEEDAALADLAVRLAEPDWKGLLSETRLRYPDVRTLAADCRRLARPGARAAIYDELVRVAAADEFHVDEVRLLDWLADVWSLQADEHAGEAPADGGDDEA